VLDKSIDGWKSPKEKAYLVKAKAHRLARGGEAKPLARREKARVPLARGVGGHGGGPEVPSAAPAEAQRQGEATRVAPRVGGHISQQSQPASQPARAQEPRRAARPLRV